MAFRKRTYQSFREFLTDFFFPLKNRKRLREMRRRQLISPEFQERLMLAVTAVNGCRYCSYFHARMALKNGVTGEEVNGMLAGDVGACPEEEAPALLYAQHWAESNARPDAEAVRRLEETYGREKADDVHLVLRMIRLGNLVGNSFDYLLYRLTFSKWGGG